MTNITAQLQRNLDAIGTRIETACANSGRTSDDVTLVAVTKYAELEWVRGLVELGVTELGESRPQQLVERVEQLPNTIRWHLIGHLQRNKARKVLPAATLIHSVDSLKLLSAIDRLAEELGLKPRLLLEVNIAGEDAKHGFSPNGLRAEWNAVVAHNHVRIAGMMAMAPRVDAAEGARPYFRQLRELRDELADPESLPLGELSMGMSGDFDVAIEEGATLIRIGSGLFEGLG